MASWAQLFFNKKGVAALFNKKGVAARATDLCAQYPPGDEAVWSW